MERHRSSLLIRLLESLQDPKPHSTNSAPPNWRTSSRRILEPDSSRRQITYNSECSKDIKFSKVNTLVGREKQFKKLSECFTRMTTKQSVEVVVIHGTAGSGKSSLVQAFTKKYLPPEVLHVYGKFDQLHSHAPYSALVAASDQLCRQILRTQNCVAIRDRIRSVLGPDVNLLGNLIPTLVQMTTTTPTTTIEDVDGMDTPSATSTTTMEQSVQKSFTRFKLLFRAFLRSVASPENPLLFFLDDLQWADSASLEVLKSIITDKLAQNIMILCAFREGEMSKEILRQYHLADGYSKDDASLSSSSSTQFFLADVTDIFVDCLDTTQLNELISIRLGMDPSTTESLSQLVWNKTNGNPFYTLSFIDMLHRNYLLARGSSGAWTWDESQILRNTDVSDNLASILESRVQSLSDQVLSILQMASFIGHEFPTSILVTIVYEEQDTIATECSFQRQSKQFIRERITAALKVAVEEGLLEETHKNDEYKFAHDKIQEVLYETLMPDETERQLLHQRIGTLIWDSVKHKEKSQVDDWFIFLATDNLNRAVDLVDYSGDRFYLVELNLAAAKRTIRKSAFLMASEYLRLAVDLMKHKTCWEERYDLCLDLFNTAAETEKNVGCYSRSAALVAIIHHNAKYIHHRSTAFAIEMDSLSVQGNVKGSALLGLKVLRQLGIRFPRKMNLFVVIRELLTTNAALGKRRLQDLLCLQEIKDENILLSLSIMNTVAINAFILGDSFKSTYAVVCLRMFRMTLKHGISKMHSPMAIVAWGSLNAVMGRFDLALESEKLAFNVIDKYNMDSIRGTTIISSFSVNHFWREKLHSDSRHEFLHAYQIAMSFGHINIAQYGFVGWVVAAMYLNDRLSDVHLKTRSVVSEMREFDSKSGLMFLLPTWQALLNFSGDEENEKPSRLRGEALDEEFAISMQEIDSKMALFNLHLMEAIVSYSFDDLEFAANNLPYINKHEKEMRGYFAMGFIQSWISTFHYESYLTTGKRIHRRLARASHRRVHTWATTGTTMLLGPNRFLDAMASLCCYPTTEMTCDEDLIQIFQDAASICSASRCQLFEALSYERLAKALYARNSEETRHCPYQNQAVRLYRKWGAKEKANHLQRIFQNEVYR